MSFANRCSAVGSDMLFIIFGMLLKSIGPFGYSLGWHRDS